MTDYVSRIGICIEMRHVKSSCSPEMLLIGITFPTSSLMLKIIDIITHAICNQMLRQFFHVTLGHYSMKSFLQKIVYIILVFKSPGNNLTLLSGLCKILIFSKMPDLICCNK